MKIKRLSVVGCICLFHMLSGQKYNQLISEAQNYIKNKEYCKALVNYNLALNSNEGIAEKNPYTFYYAAKSAGYCNDTIKSKMWLLEAQKNGFGSNSSEIMMVEKDSAFIQLHSSKEWGETIKKMTDLNSKTQAKNKEWVEVIAENASKIVQGKKINATSRFALYFTQVKDIKVPYLVYIPQKIDLKKSSKMIVYLHGGVVNTEKFNYDNHETPREPIFSVGEELNTIIVYPFGKKDFGWAHQQEAFDNIFTIINEVKKNFKIDDNNIFLGGMSNGANATFYFASQKPNIFKGFFAISPGINHFPKKIEFKNLSQGKKIITLHAKDDTAYSFKDIHEIYLENKDVAKDWEFQSLDEGEHGFIYTLENGKNLLKNVIVELMNTNK